MVIFTRPDCLHTLGFIINMFYTLTDFKQASLHVFSPKTKEGGDCKDKIVWIVCFEILACSFDLQWIVSSGQPSIKQMEIHSVALIDHILPPSVHRDGGRDCDVGDSVSTNWTKPLLVMLICLLGEERCQSSTFWCFRNIVPGQDEKNNCCDDNGELRGHYNDADANEVLHSAFN